MTTNETRRWWSTDIALLAYLALAKFLLHLAFINQYGYFRDEFYYLACGRHLAWGYVDFPPVIGLIGAFVQGVMGDSLLAVRFFPVLAGAGVVFGAGAGVKSDTSSGVYMPTATPGYTVRTPSDTTRARSILRG